MFFVKYSSVFSAIELFDMINGIRLQKTTTIYKYSCLQNSAQYTWTKLLMYYLRKHFKLNFKY